MTPEPIDRRSFDAADLVSAHPPVWQHPNKAVVAEISCPPGAIHRGTLGYSRWAAIPLPDLPGDDGTGLIERPGFYDYAPIDPTAVEWHVNFADPHLFVAYGTSLLAQDELQVAEHPALGSLREALVAEGSARTVDGSGPTPVLVTGVERRCRIAVGPDVDDARSLGLYGNAFAAASASDVRRATSAVEPPTITNLVAMAAPAFGNGRYTATQVRGILVTASTAFAAAVTESARIGGPTAPTVVHTGFWGCGAFGGNRILMAALQVLAARMAGVGTLVFHVGDAAGSELFADALGFLEDTDDVRSAGTTEALIESVVAYGFRWGVSDGT